MATDTYLAALPEVQRSLSTSATVAQLTITSFIIGVALGQLLFGPLSDGLGRRRMLLAAAVSFVVLSALCALAPSGLLLVVLRLLQGVVGGCGVAVGRAVVSDRYTGVEAAARYGTLTAITLLGPVVAPAIGGLILVVGDWRTVFAFLAVVGVLMTLGVLFGIPETLPAQLRHTSGLASSGRRMRQMLGDPHFRAPVIVQCFATGGFFIYIGGSSFVLQEQLHLSQSEYTLLFASNAAGMAVASATFRILVVRLGPAVLRNVGLSMSTIAAFGLAVVAALVPGPPPLAVVWAVLAVIVAGMGMCIPGTTALAQQAGRWAGGTASALQGGLVFVVGAFATPLTGVTGRQTVLVMAGLMATLFACAALALVLTSRSSGPLDGEPGAEAEQRDAGGDIHAAAHAPGEEAACTADEGHQR